MEVKFNVSESKLNEWFIGKLATMPIKECMDKLKDCPGVTSPDFNKSQWGHYTQPKQPRVAYALFNALRDNKVKLVVRQRRGYKCFAFMF